MATEYTHNNNHKLNLENNKGPTNCLSVGAEILVLGVETRASSHPVGSKSFASKALELNVGATPANIQH